MLTKEQASQIAEDLVRQQLEMRRDERNRRAKRIPLVFRLPSMSGLDPYEKEDVVLQAKRAVIKRKATIAVLIVWAAIWLGLWWGFWLDEIVGIKRVIFLGSIILPMVLLQVWLVRQEIRVQLQGRVEASRTSDKEGG